MTSPLTLTGIRLATNSLAKHGKPATITWPGAGATATRAATSVTQTITILPGKRTTQIINGAPVALLNAIMSAVDRNPIGSTITLGAMTYRVISSDDLGEAPDAIAAHKLVLV